MLGPSPAIVPRPDLHCLLSFLHSSIDDGEDGAGPGAARSPETAGRIRNG